MMNLINERYNVDRPNISPSEVVNITPAENQISFSNTLEPNWEAFSKEYSTEKTSVLRKEKLKYVQASLKCCVD